MWVVLIINSEDTRLVECESIDEMLNVVTDKDLEGTCRVVRGSLQDPKALLQKCIEFGKWDVTDDIDTIQTFQSNVGLTGGSDEDKEEDEVSDSSVSGSVRLDKEEMSVDDKIAFLRSLSGEDAGEAQDDPAPEVSDSVRMDDEMTPEEKAKVIQSLSSSAEPEPDDKRDQDRRPQVPGVPLPEDGKEQRLLKSGK